MDACSWSVDPDRLQVPTRVKNPALGPEVESTALARPAAVNLPDESTAVVSALPRLGPPSGPACLPRRTRHHLVKADSRDLSFLPDDSIHLIVTSPPYWTLKSYNNHPAQLGHVQDYEEFLAALDRVWTECYRVLVPGGRLVCIVGDVCLSRKRFGRHFVMPLHADVTVHCRLVGFDNLTPILWHKITNATYEEAGDRFFGRPCEPNAILKNDLEYILMQRKPGAYRTPTPAQRRLSVIPKHLFDAWFRQTWDISGEPACRHPAPFPIDLPYRLIRLFSFVGDTVLDPFVGTGTTMVAALEAGRNSIGVDVDAEYVKMARDRLRRQMAGHPNEGSLDVSGLLEVSEDGTKMSPSPWRRSTTTSRLQHQLTPRGPIDRNCEPEERAR